MSSAPTAFRRVSVVIPAYNEQGRVAATVAAARGMSGVVEVVVVDDGSSDATAPEAEQAGARVIRAPHRGKGAALRRGVGAATGELVLLLDADLGTSASAAEALVGPVAEGRADMAIAVLPAPRVRPGLGIALAAARLSLWLLTGRWFAAPLSGQRCMTANLARALPWARGFAAEVAVTADAAALGARVIEVPTEIEHAPTSRSLAGFVHRGRQFGAVIAAFAPRLLYPIGPTARPAPSRRLIAAMCGWAVLIAVGARLHPWLLAACAVAAFSVSAVAASLAIGNWAGIRRPNYRGTQIPTAAGVGFALAPLAAWGLAAAGALPRADVRLVAYSVLAAVVMSAVGLLDDLYGSRQVSGLAGHLASVARGRITTGAVKAAAGIIVGLAIGWLLARPGIAQAIINGAVIALSANLVNLLDLRPGRALKGFFLLAVVAVAVDPQAVYAVGPIGVVALALAPLDLGGRAMMGDAGANALGAAAGVALAAALPLWGRLVLVVALAGIHVYSERRSLSQLIARAPALRWLDRLGRPEEDAP